ncbi:hypothetical protein [Spirosoma sp.]|uniref:hypothetical protein n=1 Tax=Spirosoma sp. TaxID=1899569 RepID=UPI00261AF23F|nr:hypothetical protein [Spirosoma sp.]MCX6218329.1 hypothetical protein [Spirosoma sp.]
MKHVQILFLLLFGALSAKAQVPDPYPIRIYRFADQVSIADSNGNNGQAYAYSNVTVRSINNLLRVTIVGQAGKYYRPAQFRNVSGVPYGSTADAAYLAYLLATPASSGGGGGSGTVIADASQINTGILPEERLPSTVIKTSVTYSNPSWLINIDPSKIAESSTKRFVPDSKITQWDSYSTTKQSVITNQVDITPRNVNVNGTLTAPTPVTGTASNVVATTKFTYDEVMRLLRDTLLAQYKPLFDANQFVTVDTIISGTKISFIRIKPGLLTGTASATATSGTVVTGRVALTFTDAGVAAPIVAVDSSSAPLRYYKGGSLVDWDSGPNSGVSTTRLPAGTEGYLEMRYFPMQDFAAIGFNTSGVKTEQNLSRYQAGIYVNSSGKIATVVQGRASLEVASTFTAASGSYIRLRRTTTGTFNVEYSTDGTTYNTILTDIRSTVPSVTPITSELYGGIAIHFNGRVYMPSSSNNFVTY